MILCDYGLSYSLLALAMSLGSLGRGLDWGSSSWLKG
jgi:hypothetical protein